MKWLNSILSIYIVILSCLPCTDGSVYEVIDESYTQAISIEADSYAEHSHADGESDKCPPFCDCNCCGAQVLTYSPYQIFEFPLRFVLIESKNIYYKSNLLPSFFGSIWQPPQIV